MELTAKVMRMMAVQFFEKLNNGLIPDEYVVLDIIACNENICQRDLARLILKNRANTGRIVESLEKKGYINRVADTKNNRLVRKLNLTEIGHKMVDDITKKIQIQLEETDNLISTEEIGKLKDGIRAFRVSLEKLTKVKI